MHSATSYPTYLRTAFAALAAMLAASCGDASAPALRETGAIEVTVATTTGPAGETDPDGYSLSVDHGAPQLISDAEAVTMGDLAMGRHIVRLQGLAPGCYVNGANPFSVAVSSTSTTPVHFSVVCGTTPGIGDWDY